MDVQLSLPGHRTEMPTLEDSGSYNFGADGHTTANLIKAWTWLF